MTRFVISVAAAIFGFSHYLAAQVPDPFQFDGNGLVRALTGLPSIALADQDRFSFMTALGWQTPIDYLPPFNPVEPQRTSAVKANPHNSSPNNIADISIPDRIYVGGEVGFTYGRSSGKYGYEFEQGYIIGEIGNDKFHLTIGMSRDRVSGHGWGR